MSNVKRNRPAYSGRIFCALTATALMGAIAISGSSIPALAQDVQTGQITVIADQDDGQASTGNSAGGISLETKDAAVVISSEDLDLIGATDLQDVFSQETSVSVATPTPSTQRIFINGIDETNLNIQIDGARQTNNLWHHNGSTLIDPSLLKAVDVNPGVAPADVGPAALGGSIRFETKDVGDLLEAGRSLGAYVYGAYDTNSETFLRSGAVYGRSNGFEVLGFASYADGENFEDGGGNTVPGTAADLTSAIGKIAYEATSGDRFELSTDYTIDQGLRNWRGNIALLPFRPFNDFANIELSRHTSVLSYQTTKPTANYDPEINIYYNEAAFNIDYNDNGTPPGEDFDSDIKTFGGKAENTFTIAPGKITAGFDYVNDKSNRRDGTDSLSEEVSNLGFYTQARLEHMEGFRISAGLRSDFQWFEGIDGSEFYNHGFSPNATGEWDLTDRFTLIAGLARTFGGIPLAEAGGLYNDPVDPPVYDQNIESQWAQSFRVGGRFIDKGLTLKAFYFDTKIEDFVNQYHAAGPGGAVPRSNLGVLSTEGVEVSARYNWSNAFLRFNYSHTEVKVNGEYATPFGLTGLLVATPVGDIFAFSGAYTWPELSLTVGFSSEVALDFDEIADKPGPGGAYGTLEGYEVLNVFAEWTPKMFDRLTVRAEVNNIFDEQYTDRATPTSVNLEPLYEPGRSAKLSGRIEF